MKRCSKITLFPTLLLSLPSFACQISLENPRGAEQTNEASSPPLSLSLSLSVHTFSPAFSFSLFSLFFFFYIYLPSIDICLRISPRVSFNVSFCRFNTSFPRLSSSSSFRAVKINASIKRNALLVFTSYYCYFNYKRLCKCGTFDETRFNARVMKFVRSLKFFAISFDLKVHRKRDRREFEIKIRTSLRGDEQRAFISDTKEVYKKESLHTTLLLASCDNNRCLRMKKRRWSG